MVMPRSVFFLSLYTILISHAIGLQDAVETILDPLPPSFENHHYDFNSLKPLNAFVDPLPGYKSTPQTSKSNLKISGGEEAEAHNYPYQVALIVDGNYFCGGSLISSSWVLSAAHCTVTARSIQVIMGAHDLQAIETTQVTRSASRVLNHANYSSSTLANDISVIYLSSPVTLSRYINTIALAPEHSGSFEGSTGRLTGWGYISPGSGAVGKLQTVTLTVMSNSACATVFGSTVTDGNICTSGASNQGICDGDNGSPLVVSSAQVGIVSFTSQVCGDTAPSVYTRVSSFRSWISSNTNV